VRPLATGLTACVLLAGALAPAQAEQRALPEKVVVHDSRTSEPVVDISTVTLNASWYWDSEQSVYVTVPNGFKAGHRLDVFFDLNGDSVPDGHYDLKLLAPKKKGGKQLRIDDEFRIGGGWTLGGKGARCSDSEGSSPAAGGIRVGEKTISLGLDLWSCLQTPNPSDSGSWRAAVRVAMGKQADMAPNGQKWSKAVAGWGPCDPSGGSCP
jgi:hypothetical protein